MSYLILSLFTVAFLQTAVSLKVQDAEGSEPPTHHVFEIPEHNGLSSRPDPFLYKDFYDAYKLKFVSKMPEELMKGHSAELVVLGAKVSEEFNKRMGVDGGSGSHTGLGLLVKDEKDQEVARIALNYWACLSSDVDAPHLLGNKSLTFLNRAIVTFTVSHGSWEGGYWTQVIPVTTLNQAQYHRALSLSKDFASRYPYLQGNELWVGEGKEKKLQNPAVTCNTFVQDIVWQAAKRDVWAEKLITMGHLVAHMDAKKVKPLHEHHNIRLFQTPVLFASWYDEHGVLKETKETPSVIYVSQPGYLERCFIRNNNGAEVNILKFVPPHLV